MTIRIAVPEDRRLLAELAAATLPLVLPPGTSSANKASFIRQHLSETRFAAYLTDDDRTVLVDADADRPRGYTMLVSGEPGDADVAAAISLRPTVELSKCYVRPEHQGRGIAQRLLDASFEAARAHGAIGIWLAVNLDNHRAIRFYERNGFGEVGRTHFS